MANRPTAPTGDFTLIEDAYGIKGTYEKMSENEMLYGRNNTGESETPLGSFPDAQKDNYLFQYMTQHIIYLTRMVEYLENKINGGA